LHASSRARTARVSVLALTGEVLSLACPRESTQREGHPEPSSAGADPLRSSSIRGARTTRSQSGIFNPALACLKQGARPDPGLPAVLGEGNGSAGGRHNTVGAAEHRSENRIKRAACLSVSSASEIASSASAGFHEKRREPASAGKPPGPHFFWILFFGGAKKSISPQAKPDPHAVRARKPA